MAASYKERLEELRGKIAQCRELLRIEEKKARKVELEKLMEEQDFWSDRQSAKVLSQELSGIKEETEIWDGLLSDVETLIEFFQSGDRADDESLEDELRNLEKRFVEHEFRALFSGPHDASGAIVAIHAGTGGVDAMDWAEILLRMYLRFCEKMKWQVKMLDEQRGGEAGIKTAILDVRGRYAYGYLKAEHGVHRLVRISPFDAESLRQTSFALVEVVPDLGESVDIVVKPEDLRIDVYRAGGHGGQSVNTTDSAVRITHIPTGIVVTCQNERSQLQNKESAMRYLKAKLARLTELEREEEKKELRGAYTQGTWGNQIRSYVLNPYRLVKDHRTDFETQDVEGVLGGEILPFIEAYLRSTPGKK